MKQLFRARFALCLAAGASLSSVACDKKDATPSTEGAASPSAAASGPAESPEGTSPTAPSAAAKSSGSEWYASGTGDDLKLTWAVYPVIADGEFGPDRRLEVVVRRGKAVHRVALGVQKGDLEAERQSVCNPSLKVGETVSQLQYSTVGNKAFYAKRVQPDLLEISYFVNAEPEERKVVAKIPIPKSARVTDAISDIRDAANERPFDCKTGSSSAPSSALKVSASAKVIDTADWKTAKPGSTLALRWTVDQSRAKPTLPKNFDPEGDGPGGRYDGDRSKVVVPLDLVLNLNGRSRSVSLQANAGVAASPVCGAVSFYWAGLNVPFELKRAEGGKVVLTKTGKQVYVFDVPAGVKVTQELIVVAADGKRTSKKDCKPTTL